MMDGIEPLAGVSADESTPTIERITAAEDFRSANKHRKMDLRQGKRPAPECAMELDDRVVLSAIAHVSLLEDEGLNVAVIATELGLTAAEVWADAGIAAEICHPSGSNSSFDKP
jgi:hypothetical protein